MSPPMIVKMAFVTVLLRMSPTPIHLKPEHLSSGIRWHATNALSPSGLTLVVAMEQPMLASAMLRLLNADLREEQSFLQSCASDTEGPAVPWVCRACFMASESKPSNVMGFTDSRRERASGSLP